MLSIFICGFVAGAGVFAIGLFITNLDKVFDSCDLDDQEFAACHVCWPPCHEFVSVDSQTSAPFQTSSDFIDKLDSFIADRNYVKQVDGISDELGDVVAFLAKEGVIGKIYY